MSRPRRAFKVEHLAGNSDKPGEAHFAISGPAVDDTFAQSEALANFLEAALNAAHVAFAAKSG